jgi:hypothetical protein
VLKKKVVASKERKRRQKKGTHWHPVKLLLLRSEMGEWTRGVRKAGQMRMLMIHGMLWLCRMLTDLDEVSTEVVVEAIEVLETPLSHPG